MPKSEIDVEEFESFRLGTGSDRPQWHAPPYTRPKSSVIVLTPPKAVDSGWFDVSDERRKLPDGHQPRIRERRSWRHVATLITRSATGTVELKSSSGHWRSEEHWQSFARSVGVEAEVGVDFIAEVNLTVSTALGWNRSAKQSLEFSESHEETVTFTVEPHTALTVWQPTSIVESDSGLAEIQLLPWYRSSVQAVEPGATTLVLMIAGKKVEVELPTNPNALPDLGLRRLGSKYDQPQLGARQAAALRYWWDTCDARWDYSQVPVGLRPKHVDESSHVGDLFRAYPHHHFKSLLRATDVELGQALPPVETNFAPMSYEETDGGLKLTLRAGFRSEALERRFRHGVQRDWELIAAGGYPARAKKQMLALADADQKLFTEFTWLPRAATFVTGGRMSKTDTTGMSRENERASEFAESIGASVSAGTDTGFASMSLTLDTSISKSEGHAYALGLTEENSTSYELDFPHDGVVRQAGYGQLVITHRTKAPGPSITDVPNVVLQWEIPLK